MQIILSQSHIDNSLYTPGVVEQMKTKQGWERNGITYYHESVWTKSS